ncbi:MAG TPA: copper resistance system multicopper oxidase [Nitrospiraceae bacterium]|nr:copper resistance system multicopper oxidase [Nitrospiraceae bacterium]
MKYDFLSRRLLFVRAIALSMLLVVALLVPACTVTNTLVSPGSQVPLRGDVIDLTISEQSVRLDEGTGRAVTINGAIPGPVIRLKEGQQATLRVTNHLKDSTSIHWHGILLPPEMDGVPGVSFAGIEPGATFTYRFPVKQSGTYWFHSHSGSQELLGMYAPMIIDPIEPEPFSYERDYVVMLSDWSFESPDTLFSNLKKRAGYYNFQKRAAGEFFTDVRRMGFWPAVQNYLMWDQMRMDPTDFADVTGYTFTYLMNGLPPTGNWTGLFRPGERVRLRFINAASMTIYDVRIPGLKMTVVQADGQNIQPVVVEEFRVGVAETYDVIVEPVEDRAYTIFAETMDRSGYARGTLATRTGMAAAIPQRRPRPLRTMEDMGMPMEHKGMEGHGHDSGRAMPGSDPSGSMPSARPSDDVPTMEHMHHGSDTQSVQGLHQTPRTHEDDSRRSEIPGAEPVKHGPDDHGPGNQTVAEYSKNRSGEPGRGLEHSERRILLYTDLKSLEPYPDQRKPEREIELHLTGHMERFMWSFDGKKYSDAPEPIHFHYGERVRLTFVNDTMMEHPIHLHGMWMHLENGTGEYLPRKHVVIVKPAERLSVAVTADAPGAWAFHCHLLFHMEAGMFRVVEVSQP